MPVVVSGKGRIDLVKDWKTREVPEDLSVCDRYWRNMAQKDPNKATISLCRRRVEKEAVYGKGACFLYNWYRRVFGGNDESIFVQKWNFRSCWMVQI